MREQHVIHLLIRKRLDGRDLFFVYPRAGWLAPTGEEYLCLPTKRSVREPLAPYAQGKPLDHFVDAILQEDLGLAADDYVLEQELPCVIEDMLSPVHQEPTRYSVYPVDVWVAPARRERRALAWLGQGRGVQGRPGPARGRGAPGREGEDAT